MIDGPVPIGYLWYALEAFVIAIPITALAWWINSKI